MTTALGASCWNVAAGCAAVRIYPGVGMGACGMVPGDHDGQQMVHASADGKVVPQKVENRAPCDPAIVLLGIYPKDVNVVI